MPEQVHIHPKVERQLCTMESSTNAPSIAADRARKIILALIEGQRTESSGRLQAKADTRVKNSCKFNLGAGYRLICIRTKKIFYVMHVGDHESCDVWLNNHSKKSPHKTEIQMKTFSVQCCRKKTNCTMDGPVQRFRETAFDNDDPCLQPIPQEYLRKVFKGLVAG